MALLSFQELIDKHDRDNLNLMLGNGFSISACPDTFNYELLYRQAKFGDRSQVISSLFDRFGTYDFEEIMERLNSAKEVCTLYHVDSKVIDQLTRDQECLKQGLIAAITDSHPSTSLLIDPPHYNKTREFISRFSNIFSLNYDLLLYWAINKTDVDALGYCSTKDGFNGAWQPENEQNVFYLHGGLHLYESSGKVHKIKSSGIGANLISQVNTNLYYERFPLFVSEPTSDKKLEKIKHNPYLLKCYEELQRIKGVLVIHGHSLYDNDDHIIEAVKDSHIEKIYIGIYDTVEFAPSNLSIKTKATGIFGDRVEFYDSRTVPIWGA